MTKDFPKIPQECAVDPYLACEWTKMLDGEVYDAAYPQFTTLLMQTRRLIRRYNDADPCDSATLHAILHRLLGAHGHSIVINQPFRCDYGCNIAVGDKFFANFNLTILDEATVTFGDNVFIGPDVSIYTACHPLDPVRRRTGEEWARPVKVGNDVWIGGGATILPGVTIGDGAVIGAGSVVSRDVAPRTIVAGNPARVIKEV